MIRSAPLVLLRTLVWPLLSLLASPSSEFCAAFDLLSSIHRQPTKSRTAGRILCKTVETFKLADLYQLEISMKARLSGMTCKRIGIDPATGSSLLVLEDESNQDKSSQRNGDIIENWRVDIPIVSSIEWMGVELAAAASAERLIKELQSRADEIECVMRESIAESSSDEETSWTMDYIRMGLSDGLQPQRRPSTERPTYTSKTLAYCVAQALNVPAALHPSKAALELVLVDSQDASSLRLCIVTSRGCDEMAISCGHPSTTNIKIVREQWSSRPFQYSSAMNANAAAIIVDILLNLCKANESGESIDGKITLLDPTCGSGTFLAYAMASGANVVGWDVNERCVGGTKQNLDYMIEQGMVLPRHTNNMMYSVERRDAALVKPDANNEKSHSFDCVVANLPWGQNAPTYFEENSKILEALHSLLRPGTPCAFISRYVDIQKELTGIGFDIIGMACIPQSNFRLPKSRKKRRKDSSKDGADEEDSNSGTCSSRCVVSLAVTA